MSEKRGEGRPCWYEDGYDGLYIMALAIYRFHLSSKEILTDFGISQVPYLPDVVHLHLLHGSAHDAGFVQHRSGEFSISHLS